MQRQKYEVKLSKEEKKQLQAILEGNDSFEAAKKRYIDQAKKMANKNKDV